MELPSLRECPAVVGVAIGILGGIIGLALTLFVDVSPWGFVLLAISGFVLFSSVIYCLAWRWEVTLVT